MTDFARRHSCKGAATAKALLLPWLRIRESVPVVLAVAVPAAVIVVTIAVVARVPSGVPAARFVLAIALVVAIVITSAIVPIAIATIAVRVAISVSIFVMRKGRAGQRDRSDGTREDRCQNELFHVRRLSSVASLSASSPEVGRGLQRALARFEQRAREPRVNRPFTERRAVNIFVANCRRSRWRDDSSTAAACPVLWRNQSHRRIEQRLGYSCW